MDKRILRAFDFPLLGVTLALVAMGLISVFSATRAGDLELLGNPYYHLLKQGLAVLIGLIALFLVVNVDYEVLEDFSRPIYIFNALILGVVLVAGKVSNSAQSWLGIGPTGSFQPSEIAKILVVITLAKFLSDKEGGGFREFLGACLAVGLPVMLVLAQPDMGTALVFMAILYGVMFVAGINLRYILGSIILAAALSPLAFFFVLKPYQQARFLAFVNPYSDPVKTGYNVIQSMIAIGSGRFFGKGLFSGTQTQLNFVPEHHTDFIFSVIGEEFGFLGGIFVLAAYFYIIWRGVQIMQEARDNFGRLIAAGVVSMLAFHIFINVGMNLGIMPVTGIPLPFLSFGGSAMIADLIGVGLLLSVHYRRQKIVF